MKTDTDNMSKSIESYISELKAKHLHKKTIRAYERLLTELEGIKPLNKFTKADLINYFNGIQCADSSRNLRLTLAKKYFTDINKPNVISWIEIKPLADKLRDVDILNDSEVALLIETSPTYYSKALIAFLYDTGARISEAMSLTFNDLHTIEGIGVVVHIPTTKTAAGYRKTVLTYSDVLLRNLETYTERKKTDKIFSLSYSQNRRIVMDIAQESGLDKKVTLHRFRHAHARQLVKNGTSNLIICKELGWSQTSPMLARYTHISDDDVINSKLQKAGIVPSKEITKTEIKQPEPLNIITTSKKITTLEGENKELKARLESIESMLSNIEVVQIAKALQSKQVSEADKVINESLGLDIITDGNKFEFGSKKPKKI